MILERLDIYGLTLAEWVRLALEALDQADVSPAYLADAYQCGRGEHGRVIDELVEEEDR
jgi:hypothetical protein